MSPQRIVFLFHKSNFLLEIENFFMNLKELAFSAISSNVAMGA